MILFKSVQKRCWILLLFVGVLLSSCTSSKPSVQLKVEPPLPSLPAEIQHKYDYYFLEAVRLRAKGEYDAAYVMLQHCVELAPSQSEAQYELAQIYLFLKDPERAERAFRMAYQHAPANYWYAQTMANYCLQVNKTEEAVSIYEKMTQRFPKKLEPIYALVEIYTRQQNFEEVITTLNRLEQKAGKSEEISMEKFRIYLQLKDDKHAFREIESLANEYPMDLRYQVVLGDVYLQHDKAAEAYDLYQKVLAAEPNNAMALYSLASYYEKIGEKERYEQQLDTILLNKRIDTDTRLNVMRQYVLQSEQEGKDSTQIISRFQAMLSDDSDDAQLPMLYAQYLFSKNMKKEVVPVLEQVVQRDPTNAVARLQLLQFAIQRNDSVQVVKICEGGTLATPEKLEFHFYLAIGYNQANRPKDVLEACRRGLTYVTPDSDKQIVSDFYSIMGDVYHSEKQEDLAYAAYDSALVYNSSNIGALNNYAYYLSVEGRELDKAEEMSYKTVKAEPSNGTYLDTYAWILYEKGKYAEALLYIDQAIKNGGDDSDVVLEHCGDIHYVTGDVEGAVKYWKQSLGKGNKSQLLPKKIQQKKLIK